MFFLYFYDFLSEKNNQNQCRNCKIWSGNIIITGVVLTGFHQQYSVCLLADRGPYMPTSFMAGMHTGNETNHLTTPTNWTGWTWNHIDFQVFTSIYCQKPIEVNVISKRIIVQCVWLWYQQLLWKLTIKQSPHASDQSECMYWIYIGWFSDHISLHFLAIQYR